MDYECRKLMTEGSSFFFLSMSSVMALMVSVMLHIFKHIEHSNIREQLYLASLVLLSNVNPAMGEFSLLTKATNSHQLCVEVAY